MCEHKYLYFSREMKKTTKCIIVYFIERVKLTSYRLAQQI